MTTIADIPLSTILAKLRGQEAALRAKGIGHMFVFGSRVRGDHRPDSDLDVLIEVDSNKPFGWKSLTGAMAICEDAVGIPTQITMRSDLTPRVAERIADDLREVF